MAAPLSDSRGVPDSCWRCLPLCRWAVADVVGLADVSLARQFSEVNQENFSDDLSIRDCPKHRPRVGQRAECSSRGKQPENGPCGLNGLTAVGSSCAVSMANCTQSNRFLQHDTNTAEYNRYSRANATQATRLGATYSNMPSSCRTRLGCSS